MLQFNNISTRPCQSGNDTTIQMAIMRAANVWQRRSHNTRYFISTEVEYQLINKLT